MTSGERYVLDAFALLAFFLAEPAGPRVRELLDEAAAERVELSLCVINLAEVLYRLERERGEVSARSAHVLMTEEFSIQVVDADRDLSVRAARLKAHHPISLADAYVAALAMRLDATLVTGDPDFRLLEDRVAVEWLTDHETPAQ